MAITYYGVATNPADNSGNGDGASVAVTPPASMVAGDFCYFYGHIRSTGNIEVDVTGGQTWTQEDQTGVGTHHLRAAWCRYNGTWAANPSWRTDFVNGSAFSGVLVVFRPTTGANTWAVDVAENEDTFTASSPAFVTVVGQTSIAASTVTIVTWFSRDDNTWALQTGGWTNPGGNTQFRNNYTNSIDLSTSVAYKIQTSPGATGAVSNRQVTLEPDNGHTLIQTFKEVSAAGNNAGPMVSQIRLKSMTGSALAG